MHRPTSSRWSRSSSTSSVRAAIRANASTTCSPAASIAARSTCAPTCSIRRPRPRRPRASSAAACSCDAVRSSVPRWWRSCSWHRGRAIPQRHPWPPRTQTRSSRRTPSSTARTEQRHRPPNGSTRRRSRSPRHASMPRRRRDHRPDARSILARADRRPPRRRHPRHPTLHPDRPLRGRPRRHQHRRRPRPRPRPRRHRHRHRRRLDRPHLHRAAPPAPQAVRSSRRSRDDGRLRASHRRAGRRPDRRRRLGWRHGIEPAAGEPRGPRTARRGA